MPDDYDSRESTEAHIKRVDQLLGRMIVELHVRADNHDYTKLQEPEKSLFDEYTPKLAALTYGSGEYMMYMEKLRSALDHHYAAHRHHPEHFKSGYREMNLIDVVEMLCDWKAATERHDDGDLATSIQTNRGRFGYGDEFQRLLENTARDLGWIE